MQVAKPVAKAEDGSSSNKNVQNTKPAGKSEVDQQLAKKSESAVCNLFQDFILPFDACSFIFALPFSFLSLFYVWGR